MGPEAAPRLRVDAQRNRDALVAAATRAFASAQAPASLNAIAREAGVGPGTLYRHFPTREDLVLAVYEDQVARLGEAARELLRDHPPAIALSRWFDVFCDWAATKHGMIDTLRATVSSGRLQPAQMRTVLVTILCAFLQAGARAGDLRADVDPVDLAALLAGILTVSGSPDQRPQTRRMLDLVADGLAPRGPTRARPGC